MLFKIKKGEKGFGFSVANSIDGQKVAQVIESDRYYCLHLTLKLYYVFRSGGLQSNDLIVAIDGSNVQSFTNEQLIAKLKSFPAKLLIQVMYVKIALYYFARLLPDNHIDAF